ncbi:MAG: glycosyltransferase family 1 protein [Calothrix sp. MO_192.B10]|nr:glycosyltransferase family 1 protein [Calothrix sp. MO_192.B10]
MKNSLVINLSFVPTKPTGIATYALNLLPWIQAVKPVLLTPDTINLTNYDSISIPSNLTPEEGTKGHFNRLVWTQFHLPKIYRNLQSSLLFSPLPEAPLFCDFRYIVTVHDLIPLRFAKPLSRLTAYFRYYIPQVLEQAQHIICNSQATAKDITDFYHIPPNKITPIPLAHDPNHFRPLDKTENFPYFLYLGRQDPYKNLQRLITAFAALPNCSDYQLWLAGPTDKRYTPLLKTQVAELGITHQVKFLNYVPYSDLPTIINQALALVFPSLWEGFGFPVLEAMACGTPVITSNISSLPEVAGDAAILINPYNTSEITEAMEAIVTDMDLRDRLSVAGINRANQFSWENTGQATVEVLHKFL